MKNNAEIRRVSLARLRQGRWFVRIFALTLLFGSLQHLVAVSLDEAYTRLGLQTWMDYLVAKAEALYGGLAYAVPSRAVLMQMNQATIFLLFITIIFAGIGYLGLATVTLKAAKDDANAWCRDALRALCEPLGCGALAFLVALRIVLWSLVLIVPGIIASYRYSQVWNVRAEHPTWGASRCIAESARLMAGRKGQRFCLDLFFACAFAAVLFAVLLLQFTFVPEPILLAGSLLSMSVMMFLLVWLSLARAVFYREACAAAGEAAEVASGECERAASFGDASQA